MKSYDMMKELVISRVLAGKILKGQYLEFAKKHKEEIAKQIIKIKKCRFLRMIYGLEKSLNKKDEI